MCMMISYYYDNLFTNQNDFSNFKGLITYLVSEATDNTNVLSIRLMATESLKGIFEFNEPKQQIIQFVNESLFTLIQNLKVDSLPDYFEIIQNICDHYHEQVIYD